MTSDYLFQSMGFPLLFLYFGCSCFNRRSLSGRRIIKPIPLKIKILLPAPQFAIIMI